MWLKCTSYDTSCLAASSPAPRLSIGTPCCTVKLSHAADPGKYGGLKLDQAKCLKELERENAKLKRLVAELSLEKQILKDVAEGNF